ncbi:TetR family transcriptional regulator [Mycobacterium sp. MS1601]|uniref:TetR/AcrR family transcriptional regulator n=1 Tax=Mycobacterium sp. MS1601 TaxID=1936029 RepID=UPI0009793F81|nr:TetR/AcrR family transcriptional regulator [Mycobacterium sp. MS1601]AQA02984.1 TetR family transcriptional regulator [Mycobacterium sp. MS1601]
MVTVARTSEADPPERILRAAAAILAADGREAVSTRAVSAMANVQPPTIYRHFGDMRRLLDAAASRGLADYLALKRSQPSTSDPVEDLRHGWNIHVEFGVSNPHVYAVLYGDPRPDSKPQGVAEGDAILRGLVHRIAEVGLLRVGIERAADMLHSACRGVTLTLIATPPEQRDPDLSPATREAILTAITTGATKPRTDAGVAPRALALKSVLEPRPQNLSAAETALLGEWLDRLSTATDQAPRTRTSKSSG